MQSKKSKGSLIAGGAASRITEDSIEIIEKFLELSKKADGAKTMICVFRRNALPA